MSVRATPDSTQVPAGYADTYYEDDRSDGWVIFSGVLILLLGTLNFIDGLGAISSAHFYVAGARYVVGDLNTWGWVALCIGVAQWAVGLGVFIKNQLARWSWRRRPRAQRHRAVADDAGVSVLVAVHLRARHHRDVRPRRSRKSDFGPITKYRPAGRCSRGAVSASISRSR